MIARCADGREGGDPSANHAGVVTMTFQDSGFSRVLTTSLAMETSVRLLDVQLTRERHSVDA